MNFSHVRELERIDSLFPTKVVPIKPEKIKISKVGKFPQTLEEAKRNITNFVPSPEELAQDLDDIKPVRIEYIGDKIELIEGGLRYWAWVIKNGNEPIPTIVRENVSPISGEPPGAYESKPEVKCNSHPDAKKILINKKEFCEGCYAKFLMKNIPTNWG